MIEKVSEGEGGRELREDAGEGKYLLQLKDLFRARNRMEYVSTCKGKAAGELEKTRNAIDR